MFNKRVSKDYILERCSEEDIFSHYGIPITNDTFCSPFRNDEHPTCTIKRINGKLYFRDWAVHSKPLDFIDIVQYVYNCNYTEALEHIYEDIRLDNRPRVKKDYQKVHEKSGKSKIVVESQPFTPGDKHYLSQYGITHKICKRFRAYSLKRVYLNGSLYHVSTRKDPAIGYYFGNAGENERWKIYFYRRREGIRFICNTNRIQGWVQIPQSGSHLIITKSMKDIMTLYRLGYWSLAPQMENFMFYDYIMEDLKQRFEHIMLLYDNDHAGITYSEKFTKTFDLPHFFMRDEKDVSDYVKRYSLSQAKHYIDKHVRFRTNSGG